MIAVSGMGLLCVAGGGQQTAMSPPVDSSGAMVRLEPHGGQTQWKLGDAITVDLVFTAKAPGYAVLIEGNRFNASPEIVNVTPADGWFRFQGGEQYSGSPNELSEVPIRIPVTLNRSIVFRRPGHYEITLTTPRLRPSRTGIAAPVSGTCCHEVMWKETTNAVGLDILPRGEAEESRLAAQLSSLLETKVHTARSAAREKEYDALQHELEDFVKREPGDVQKALALTKNFYAMSADDDVQIAKKREARRQVATRLAYLLGDDAVRGEGALVACG